MNKILLGSLLGFGLVMGGTAVANADTVTVKDGDTVSQIAQQNGTTVQAIEALNNFADVNKIYVGDIIEVGTKTNTSQPASTQTTQPQAQAPKVSTQTPQVASQTSRISTNVSTSEQQAKDYIANVESRGSYTAQNGQFYGKYQLSKSYLNGDYSASNQESAANNYVVNRYGSWANAAQHEKTFGWY